MDDAAAVFVHATSEPRRRVPEAGSQLEYRAGANQPRDQVTEIAGRGTNDREIRTLRLGLHRDQFRRSRRHESIEVAQQVGMEKGNRHSYILRAARSGKAVGRPSTHVTDSDHRHWTPYAMSP